jgi:hypothetical protein
VNLPDGLDQNTEELTKAHAWWRDVQEIRFEIDTYWKFWANLDYASTKRYSDDLQKRVPWLRGFMSGGTAHTPPTNDGGTQGDFTGELDIHQAVLVHMPAGFADWPVTTHITRLELRQTGVHVEMDNGHPSSWPDTKDRPEMGPLLFSIGIVERINGVWHASAPIQLWRGLSENGGPIQSQDVGDGTGRGQLRANWFYSSAWWGPMASYQPKPGEEIGFFVCAGDCRDGNGDFSPVHERSNVVLFSLPNPNQEVILKAR